MDNKANVASEQEWNIEFHGIKYIINVIATEQMLTLEIENSETSERWSGEFTSNYIEEITHKAGNLKKFNIFTKMLQSAFNKDNESVFIDVLTFSDLEMLKARKTGQTTTSLSTSNSNNIKQYQKRYVILTYCSEFDRVHYPLPLAFEETANVSALKRTIARLRKELVQKDHQAQEPSNEREKELRQIVSQLRQDNTELKHRLRHSSSSASAMNNSFTTAGGANSNISSQNTDLINSNQKLKKQVEALKKELHELSSAYEKHRTEASREIAKWKRTIGNKPLKPQHSGEDTNATSVFDYMNSDISAVDAHMLYKDKDNKNQNEVIIELKKQLLKVQQELRVEKMKKSNDLGAASASTNRWATSNRNSPSFNRSNASPATASSYMRGVNVNNRSYSADTTQRMRATQSFVDSRNRHISPANNSNHHWGRPSTSTTSRPSSRDNSPSLQAMMNHRYTNPNHREESSSSLGGRFDPTAYQRQKQEREKYANSNKAWGAGSHLSTSSYARPTHTSISKHRYDSPINRESGYASANSQSSAGSRRSARSNSSSNQSHRGSVVSGSDKSNSKLKSKKSNKKKTSRKESHLDIGIGYKNRRNENAFDSETDSEFAIENTTKSQLMKSSRQQSTTTTTASQQLRNNKLDYHEINGAATTNNNSNTNTIRNVGNHKKTVSHEVVNPSSSSKSKATTTTTASVAQIPSASYSKKKSVISETNTISPDKLNEEHLHLLAEERFSKLIRGSGSASTNHTTAQSNMNDYDIQIDSSYNNHNNNSDNNIESTQHYDRDNKNSNDYIDIDDHPLRKSSDSVVLNNADVVARINQNIKQKSKDFISSSDIITSNSSNHRVAALKQGDIDSNNRHPLSISKDSILRTSSNSSIHSLTPSNKAISTKQDPMKKKLYTQLSNIKGTAIPIVKKSIDNDTAIQGGLSVSSSTSSFILTNPTATGAPVDEDISEIDKRIQALQSYLDNARSGILGPDR